MALRVRSKVIQALPVPAVVEKLPVAEELLSLKPIVGLGESPILPVLFPKTKITEACALLSKATKLNTCRVNFDDFFMMLTPWMLGYGFILLGICFWIGPPKQPMGRTGVLVEAS